MHQWVVVRLLTGKGQGKVRLPAVWLQVEVPKLSGGSSGMDAALERINSAVAGGATGVVLSANGSGDGDLYNAACSIKVPDGISAFQMHLVVCHDNVHSAFCVGEQQRRQRSGPRGLLY